VITEEEPSGVHARVYGIVQGVGFRYSTVMRARHLGLSGYARNMPDGSVEVVAEGSKRALGNLVSWLKKGPPTSEVDRVDHRFITPTGSYRGFGVEY
jgi:acylphosphatase